MYKNLNVEFIGIDFEIPKALELAKSEGFRGVDINMLKVADTIRNHSLQFVKDVFSQYSLMLGTWQLPIDWGKEKLSKNQVTRLNNYARLANELDCKSAWTWIKPFSDSRPYEENFKWHIERLHLIAKELNEFGCYLALEFVGTKTFRAGHKYEFIHTIEGIKKLIQYLKRRVGNVGMVLDSWHWHVSNGAISDLEKLNKEDVICVHINDASPGVPKENLIDTIRELPSRTGVIDISSFLRTLKSLDYEGSITPEPFSEKINQMGDEEAVKVTAQAIDAVWRMAALP